MKKEQNLLEVNDLSVAFDGNVVFEGVSFALAPKEVLAVIGPNGSGKTVLLKTLAGIITPKKGTVSWMPGVRIGYLPQRFHVDHYLPMTIEEFLALKSPTPEALARAWRLTGLDKSWSARDLAHLSSGELQRVLLAWALLEDPQILLFDEPTENVDVVGQDSIYRLLEHLQNATDVALIIVSHDLQAVYRYANNVLCLNKKMLCYGVPEKELTANTLSALYEDRAFFHHHHDNTGHHGTHRHE